MRNLPFGLTVETSFSTRSQLRRGDQRPHIRLLRGGIADANLPHQLQEAIREVLEARLMDVHAGTRRAVLPGVDEARADGSLRRRLDIGVLEDDEGRLAAKLHVDALERASRRTHHRLAGLAGAGQRDQAHVWMRDERHADLIAAGHDVQHAIGDVSLQRQFA